MRTSGTASVYRYHRGSDDDAPTVVSCPTVYRLIIANLVRTPTFSPCVFSSTVFPSYCSFCVVCSRNRPPCYHCDLYCAFPALANFPTAMRRHSHCALSMLALDHCTHPENVFTNYQDHRSPTIQWRNGEIPSRASGRTGYGC